MVTAVVDLRAAGNQTVPAQGPVSTHAALPDASQDSSFKHADFLNPLRSEADIKQAVRSACAEALLSVKTIWDEGLASQNFQRMAGLAFTVAKLEERQGKVAVAERLMEKFPVAGMGSPQSAMALANYNRAVLERDAATRWMLEQMQTVAKAARPGSTAPGGGYMGVDEWTFLGDALAQYGLQDAARQAYDSALQQKPRSPTESLYLRAKSLSMREVYAAYRSPGQRQEFKTAVDSFLNDVRDLDITLGTSQFVPEGFALDVDALKVREAEGARQYAIVRAMALRLHLRSIQACHAVSAGEHRDSLRQDWVKAVRNLRYHMRARVGKASETEAYHLTVSVLDSVRYATQLGGLVTEDFVAHRYRDTSAGAMAQIVSLSQTADAMTRHLRITPNSPSCGAMIDEPLAQVSWGIWVDGFRRMGRSWDALTHVTEVVAERFGQTEVYKAMLADLEQEVPHQFTNHQLVLRDISGTSLADNAESRATSAVMMRRDHPTANIAIGMATTIGGGAAGFLTPVPGGTAVGSAAGFAGGEAINTTWAIYENEEVLNDARRTGLTDITARDRIGNYVTAGATLALGSGLSALGGSGMRMAWTAEFGGAAALRNTVGQVATKGMKSGSMMALRLVGRGTKALFPNDSRFKIGAGMLLADLFVFHVNPHGHIEFTTDLELDTPLRWMGGALMLSSPQVTSLVTRGPAGFVEGVGYWAGRSLNELRYGHAWIRSVFHGVKGFIGDLKTVKPPAAAVGHEAKVAGQKQAEDAVRQVLGREKLTDIDISNLDAKTLWNVGLRMRAAETNTPVDDLIASDRAAFDDWFAKLPAYDRDRGRTYWRLGWKDRQLSTWKVGLHLRVAQANLKVMRTPFQLAREIDKAMGEIVEFARTNHESAAQKIVATTNKLRDLADEGFTNAMITGHPDRIAEAAAWRSTANRFQRQAQTILSNWKQEAHQEGAVTSLMKDLAALKEEVSKVGSTIRTRTWIAVNGDRPPPQGFEAVGGGDVDFHVQLAALNGSYNCPTVIPDPTTLLGRLNGVVNTHVAGPIVNGFRSRVDLAVASIRQHVPEMAQKTAEMVAQKEVTRAAYVVNRNGVSTSIPALIEALEKTPSLGFYKTSRWFNTLAGSVLTPNVVTAHRYGALAYLADMLYHKNTVTGEGEWSPDGKVDTGWGFVGGQMGLSYFAQRLGVSPVATGYVGTLMGVVTLYSFLQSSDQERDNFDWNRQWKNALVAQTTAFGFQALTSGHHFLQQQRWTSIAGSLPFLRQTPSMTSFPAAFRISSNFARPNFLTPQGLMLTMGAPPLILGYGVSTFFKKDDWLNASDYYQIQRPLKLFHSGWAVNPLQIYLGYVTPWGTLVGRVLGFTLLDYPINKVTPVFLGKQEFEGKMNRLLDENTQDSLDEAWQVFVDQTMSLDMGGKLALRHVPEEVLKNGGDPTPSGPTHFGWRLEPVGIKAWVEWKSGRRKVVDPVTGRDQRGYIEKMADDNPARLARFIGMFEHQIEAADAKWKGGQTFHSDTAHENAMFAFAMIAKYYAYKSQVDSGNAAFSRFAKLVSQPQYADFWNRVPRVTSRDELLMSIEGVNDGKISPKFVMGHLQTIQ